MTTKRTHGQCTCDPTALGIAGHLPMCPALYPAQQDEALTRLVRHVREAPVMLLPKHAAWTEQALALISEAREEQRKAKAFAKAAGLAMAINKAREWAADDDGDPDHETDAIVLNALADCLEDMKDPGR